MHAFLIIAHNEFDILEKVIKLLDDNENHLYIHIDKKVKDFNFDKFSSIAKKSKIFFTNRINVSWGGYSLVQCELLLLKEAIVHNYEYYHLISGVDLPLKTNEEIHDFFNKNKGKEFISYDKNASDTEIESRIKYYYLLQDKFGRSSKLAYIIQACCIRIQKILNVNRIKNIKYTLKKGTQWFSITNNLAHYIVEKENEIYNLFRFGCCVDELFLHTMVYNSNFRDKVAGDSLRYVDWIRGGPYTFTEEDFDDITSSDKIFARKFSKKVDYDIVLKIEDYLNRKKLN